jgi:hypothetical protein
MVNSLKALMWKINDGGVRSTHSLALLALGSA